MIFSEWDEAFSHQDPQTETETFSQQSITDNNILVLLDITRQLDKCIKNLEKKYGARATKIAEIPFNQLMDYIFTMYKTTNPIKNK